MLRTETYLGSKEQVKGPQWLVGTQGDWEYQESMKYTPAFLKMFDEIAVNAADNTVRHDNTKNIRFVFDKENHTISVYNDGTVPPIQKHPVHKSYVPSMIFGECSPRTTTTTTKSAQPEDGMGSVPNHQHV